MTIVLSLTLGLFVTTVAVWLWHDLYVRLKRLEQRQAEVNRALTPARLDAMTMTRLIRSSIRGNAEE